MTLLTSDSRIESNWQADRNLARNLLIKIKEFLDCNNFEWSDLSGLGIYKGPGSFTGLRIGITVMNTLASSLNIPVVGSTGENWQDQAINRLKSGENDQIVIPNYGADAKITTPKK